jgi:hypothetical protein
VELLSRRIPAYRGSHAAMIGVMSDADDQLKATWRAIAADTTIVCIAELPLVG